MKLQILYLSIFSGYYYAKFPDNIFIMTHISYNKYTQHQFNYMSKLTKLLKVNLKKL